MRRGKPCLHHLYGVPLSINAGDALCAKVFEILAANREILGNRITLDLIQEMARGAQLTSEGQAYDIGWKEVEAFPGTEAYVEMLRLKTGWYSGRGPCTAGAIIAEAPEVHRETIGNFGEAMAVAFQIRDDLLDLKVQAEDMAAVPARGAGGYGKERGGDIVEGKRTLMVIDTFHRCRPEERMRMQEILGRGRSETTPEEIEWTHALMECYGSIPRAEETCRNWTRAAEAYLDQIPATDARETLREMCLFLVG